MLPRKIQYVTIFNGNKIERRVENRGCLATHPVLICFGVAWEFIKCPWYQF
jgi:hypothetical protein